MAGFADGFRSGYGAVQRTIESNREEELEKERLENQRRRDKELAEYRDRTASTAEARIGLTRERNEFQRDRALTEDNLAIQGEVRRAQQDQIDRTRRQREDERQAEIDARQAEIDQERVRGFRLDNEANEMQLRQAQQRQAFQAVVSGLSGNGDPAATRDALNDLEGSPLHPANALGPEFASLNKTAMDFASGRRQDFDSPEFLKAVDFALSADTSIIKGMESQRPGMGQINEVDVSEVRPTEGGLQVKLNVDAAGGQYSAWITKGRSTDPNAEPATIPVEHVTDRLSGMSLYRAAMERDKGFRRQVIQSIYDSDPRKFNSAMEYAAKRHEEYLENRDDLENLTGEGEPERTLSDFQDDALRTYFGTGRLEGTGPDIEELRAKAREIHGAGARLLTDEDLLEAHRLGEI